MRRGVSSEAEFQTGRKRRSKIVEELAEDLARQHGGEPWDYYDEAEEILRKPRRQAKYNDDDLTAAGFRLVTCSDYTDISGRLLYQSVRYEHPDVPGAKTFRQRRKGQDGKWLADAGLVKVPYRWPELVARPSELVYYTEGEKDADRLAELGLLATTLAGQVWSPEAAKAFKGRDVVILGDNDTAGRNNVKKAETALEGFAASVRVVKLPGLERTEDVSDWLDKGNTVEQLANLVKETRPTGISPTPTPLLDSKAIPPRRWLYKPHVIRQFMSLLISTGGTGKSSLAIVEALALVSGKSLLGVQPEGEHQYQVWYWNGEDPIDELHRRFAAVQQHYGLTEADIGDRLFVNSGRTDPLVIAEEDRRIVRLNDAVVDAVIETVRRNTIDVIIVDPFVSSHRVSENDNAAIELVAKAWNRIAEEGNCAVVLVHHSRKPNGGELGVDDTRGASSLLAAARSARVINTMTREEATKCDIPERERRAYFSAYLGKANLTLPPEDRTWFKLTSVNLENGGFGEGDDVGVVTPWEYPKADVGKITEVDIRRTCSIIRARGPWREDQRSKKEPWVGEAIAEGLNLNLASGVDKSFIVKLVKRWIENGILRQVRRKDAHRELRVYIEAAEQKPKPGGPEPEDYGPEPMADDAAPAADRKTTAA